MNTLKLLADVRKLLTVIDETHVDGMSVLTDARVMTAAAPVRAHLIDTNDELADILMRMGERVGQGKSLVDETLNRRIDALRNWHAETGDKPKSLTKGEFKSVLRTFDSLTGEIPF